MSCSSRMLDFCFLPNIFSLRRETTLFFDDTENLSTDRLPGTRYKFCFAIMSKFRYGDCDWVVADLRLCVVVFKADSCVTLDFIWAGFFRWLESVVCVSMPLDWDLAAGTDTLGAFGLSTLVSFGTFFFGIWMGRLSIGCLCAFGSFGDSKLLIVVIRKPFVS